MILAALILQAPPAALSPKAFQARCAEFSQAKDWKGLEGAARAQLTAVPKDAAAYSALGYALFAQNRNEEGTAACTAALTSDPNRLDALLYLGLQAAREGNSAGVKSIAKRIETIKVESAIQFWKLPAVQQAVIPEPEIPLVDGEKVHFKTLSIQRVVDIAGFYLSPMVVALTVDSEGIPLRAEALMAPPGPVKAALEGAAMRWRAVPIQVDGKPSKARFVKIIQLDITTSTTTTNSTTQN